MRAAIAVVFYCVLIALVAANGLAKNENIWETDSFVVPSVIPHSTSPAPTPVPTILTNTTRNTSILNGGVASTPSDIPSSSGYNPANGFFMPGNKQFGLSRISKVRVVETLPLGDFKLEPLPSSSSTVDALVSLMDSAVFHLDICAMYWNLLGEEDHSIYSPDEMKTFGANRGAAVFAALERAIHRGVVVRVVGSKSDAFIPKELSKLALKLRLWDSSYWYGGGIMHQKLVLVDQQHAYLGSANMDWKSLAQVMEVGILIESSKVMVQDMQRLFDLWWLWSDPATTTSLVWQPVDVFIEKFQAVLRLPPWSSLAPEQLSQPNPFNASFLSSKYNKDNQITAVFDGERSTAFISASPDAATSVSRTSDEDGLIYTIQTAKKTVCLSVMDFVPFSTFSIDSHVDGSIYWPALTDAILQVIYARPVAVRLLISRWAHTSRVMVEALKVLYAQARTCPSTGLKCRGSVDIRLMEVPGWQETTSLNGKPRWPAYTRVNHAKFIITDKRANIGTSNMEWGYFYNTAGTSFNTDNSQVMDSLQKIFDRNWDSEYVKPLFSY